MFQRTLFSLVLIGGLAATVPAVADHDNGIDEAAAKCGRMFSPQDQDNCMRVVNNAEFMDGEAVDKCGRIFSPEDITACFKTISDKRYTDEQIEMCRKRFSPSDTIRCFEINGQPTKKPAPAVTNGNTGAKGIDKDYVTRTLSRAIDLLDQGETEKTRAVLRGLVQSL